MPREAKASLHDMRQAASLISELTEGRDFERRTEAGPQRSRASVAGGRPGPDHRRHRNRVKPRHPGVNCRQERGGGRLPGLRQVEAAGPGVFAPESAVAFGDLSRQIARVKSGAATNMMAKAAMTVSSASGMPVPMTMFCAPVVSAP